MIPTPTATCGDCNRAWRGASAHGKGGEHATATGHTVWYDMDTDDGDQTDREGIVAWTEEALSAGLFQDHKE